MNHGKALALCGASLVTALAVGAAAFPLDAGTPRTVLVIAHPADTVERRVTYADLNLAAASGERMLYRRVGNAVTDVCFDAVGSDSTNRQLDDCSSGAWDRARPQVARALQRAHENAATGMTSSVAAGAITIAAGKQ
jgi:UrcA family protein